MFSVKPFVELSISITFLAICLAFRISLLKLALILMLSDVLNVCSFFLDFYAHVTLHYHRAAVSDNKRSTETRMVVSYLQLRKNL